MIHIKNVKIITGTGEPGFPGEVLVQEDEIREVFHAPAKVEDALVIDGGGRLLTPGFIDAHRHCDLAALYDESFGEIELAQGITTAVMGNCGLACAPCVPEHREELYDFLEPCLGPAPRESFFPKVSDFMDCLSRKRHSLNLGVLCGTGAVTVAAKGFFNTPFEEESRRKAAGYVEDAMEAGALGLSCGIMYTPECYSALEDFVLLGKIAGKYGGYLTSHIRGEGNSLTSSVEEVLEIGNRAGVPVNISHFKVTGLKNHGIGMERAIEALERARGVGQDVTADAYPYTGGSTTILSLVPPTVLERAEGDLCTYLRTEKGLEDIRREMLREFPDWDNMVVSIGWERILISSVPPALSHLSGLDFTAAAHRESCTEEELFCRLVYETGGKTGVILMSMAQADVDRVLSLDYVSLISDSLYGGGENPHPRLYGSFPKFLREYGGKAMTIEKAIRKMTSLPARRLGISDRGTIAAGKKADILIFDPATFTDVATFESPKQLSRGLWKVFVNGKSPEESSGRIIKR